jgi:hypothetical protein
MSKKEIQKGSRPMIRKLAAGTAAAALAMSSIAAQAAPVARTAAPVAEEEGLAGGLLWPIIFAVAGGLFIILVLDDDNEEPVSP